MENFLIYILKSSLWIAVFYLIYSLFLKREIFFRFNRIFLLSGLAAAFVIPMLQISYKVVIPTLQNQQVVESETITVPTTVGLFDLLAVLYCAGIVFLAAYYLFGLYRIRLLSKTGRDANIIENKDITSSFSLFGYIFLEAGLPAVERRLILEHETAHIRQRHWLDIALCQTVCLLQWFNPFAWLYLTAIKQNHEYLADRAVLEKGEQSAVYHAALLNTAFKSPIFILTNSFSFNKYKRITMMKKKDYRPAAKLAVLFVAPALAAFLWAFAKPEYALAQDNKPAGQINKISLPSDSVPRLILVDGKETTEEELTKLSPDKIKIVTVLKGDKAVETYGDKGKNGVITISIKSSADSIKTATELTGEKVVTVNKGQNGVFTISLTKSADSDNVEVVAITPEGGSGKLIHYDKSNVTTAKPLIIIDGKPVLDIEMNALDPSAIQSITVLKDSSAYKLYGDEGKNGVIIISKKEN